MLVQIKNVSNIIVKNLICRGPGNSNPNQNWDCVNIENSKRIWFDHCTIMEGEDGNFDVVKGSDNVTASWCKFTYVTGGDHNLSNLIGSSDSETQSHGKLNVTYAYCWWDNVNSRCPRTRYGKIHVLNSYYNNVGSGAFAGLMSNVRVEGCFFESNVSKPVGLISTGGQAGVFVIDCNRGSTMTDGYNTVFAPPYQYEEFSNSEVKSKVTDPGCGAGPTLDSPADCGCYGQPKVDCNGTANGTAYLDDCNKCVGGTTGKSACIKDCNGVENGTAVLDACGLCSGGNTGFAACAGSVQGESFCSAQGVLESTNTGFLGNGYLNFDNSNGSTAVWYINSNANQTAKIQLRYANGGNAARPISVLVNGISQGTINGRQSGSWTTWISEAITINLNSGVNTLSMTSTSADGGPNLDLIALPSGITNGGCNPDCKGDIGGLAILDLCGICSGGNTGIVPNSQCVQTPFGGTPHRIPGRIEAEDFDEGLPEVAYFDSDIINEGGAPYRQGGVDIEVTQDTEGDYNVGYILNGEWLEYTVDVTATGIYDLQLRVATQGDGKKLHVELDGVNLTGPIDVPNTGGWQTWETVTVNAISLSEGEHIVRLVFDSDYMNINYIEFSDVITRMNNQVKSPFQLFPNPFNEYTKLKVDGSFEYQVFDSQGKFLRSGEGNSQLEIGSGLQKGVYLMKLYQNGEQHIVRLIKF